MLAARDVTGAVTVEEVGGEMADLAAATLSAGLAVASHGAAATDAAPCRLAVIGMGKAGGRELNYVSDVDVVFVAEPLDDGAEHDAALRTATRLASEMMRVCGEVAWPVDAGLRPEGGAGPAGAHAGQPRGLLPAVGLDLGVPGAAQGPADGRRPAPRRAYVDPSAPLVWRAGERTGLRRGRAGDAPAGRGHAAGDRAAREVKLGPGGLRDVEFAVQLLQLVHGRTDDSVRSGTTLVALEQLAAGGYVGREDARHLAEAYRWLRTVEHRLQLHRLRRTHLLPAPDDEAGLRRLARAVGYRSDVLPTFGRERAGYGHEVRRLHEKLFYRPLLRAVARLPADQARLTPAAARARLEALGFAEPAVALRHLEALTGGVSRRAVIQQTLLPAMLGWFADAADPDAGLQGVPARCRTPSAARPGTCGCCATRGRPPSGWPTCSPPPATSPTCSAGRRRRCGCSPPTPSWPPGRARC